MAGARRATSSTSPVPRSWTRATDAIGSPASRRSSTAPTGVAVDPDQGTAESAVGIDEQEVFTGEWQVDLSGVLVEVDDPLAVVAHDLGEHPLVRVEPDQNLVVSVLLGVVPEDLRSATSSASRQDQALVGERPPSPQRPTMPPSPR